MSNSNFGAIKRVGSKILLSSETAENEITTRLDDDGYEIQALDKFNASSCISEQSSNTESELINLDDIHLSDDEDTWLYTSPKDLSKEEKGVSPYKWLRKDVEDPNNYQLQMAKTALVSKLDELDILGTEKDIDKEMLERETVRSENSSRQILQVAEEMKISDVLERARLQEEKLRLSSSKFFYEAARTFPRGNRMSYDHSFGTKPSSEESLHMPSEKTDLPVSISRKKLLQSSLNYSPFGSTASLNFPADLHRSSLPNLNKSYLSLRAKKPKRTSEPHVQCPLPVYPRNIRNNSAKSEAVIMSKNILYSPTHGEAKTLPSSYRSKSKKNSFSDAQSAFSSLRRDSLPFPERNISSVKSLRRESSPCISQSSPQKNSRVTIHSQPLAANQHSSTPKINSAPEPYRSGSIALTNKRQPLSSVHNYSPKLKDKSVICENDDLNKLSSPSKIPSPSISSKFWMIFCQPGLA